MRNLKNQFRAGLNKLVRAKGYNIAYVTGLPVSQAIEQAWNMLYELYYKVYKVDLKWEGQYKDLSPIEYAYQSGHITNLFFLATALFTNIDVKEMFENGQEEHEEEPFYF